MQKLSTQLNELATQAAAVEEKAQSVLNAGHDQITAQVASARTAVQAQQSAFEASIQASQDAAKAQWQHLGQQFHTEIEKIRNDIAVKGHELTVKQAQHRAERTERYAEDAVAFAILAIASAESAVFEAIDARLYAESLAEKV